METGQIELVSQELQEKHPELAATIRTLLRSEMTPDEVIRHARTCGNVWLHLAITQYVRELAAQDDYADRSS